MPTLVNAFATMNSHNHSQSHPPQVDPYAPWLGADDLELLHFHPELSPSNSINSTSTSTSSNSNSSGAALHHHHRPLFGHQVHHQQPHHQPQPSAAAAAYPFPFQFHSPGAAAAAPAPQPSFLFGSPSPPSSTTLKAPTSLKKQPHKPPSSVASSSTSSSRTSTSSRTTSTTSASTPSTASTASALMADDPTGDHLRREKNRQKVRRHYYRKLTQLNALRSEASQLESQFHSLVVKQNETSSAAAVVPSTTSRRDQQNTELQAHHALLEHENAQLQQLFESKQRAFHGLHDLFWDSQQREDDLFMASLCAKAIFIKPFTASECLALRDKAVDDVLSLCGSGTSSSHFRNKATTRRGPGVAGWQDEVTVEDGLFKFSLSKTFRRATPEGLSNVSYPMLVDPQVYSRLFSSAVEAKCVIVQQIDAQNVVMFQEWRTMDANNQFLLMKSLFLVSRVATPQGGELVLMRGLGQDRLRDRELFLPSSSSSGDEASQIVWHDVFTWIKYDKAGLYGEDCTATFGGTAPTVGHNVPFWTIEVLHLVLRWECAVYGPPQLLKSEDGDQGEVDMANANPRTPPVEVP